MCAVTPPKRCKSSGKRASSELPPIRGKDGLPFPPEVAEGTREEAHHGKAVAARKAFEHTRPELVGSAVGVLCAAYEYALE